MRRTHLITSVALVLALAGGCHPKPAPRFSQSFWEQNRSGAVQDFMIYGFKVGIRPGGYWPVAASVYVPFARLEDAKQATVQFQPLIAARLVGAEKDAIIQRDRCARLEDDILADIRSRLPAFSVQKVILSLDIK